jgi:hypothetical protein
MSVRSLLRVSMKITASVALLAVVAGTSAPNRSTAMGTLTNSNHPSIAASDYYPMVHLRKLHLVRPDLIPYPIYYSVYC